MGYIFVSYSKRDSVYAAKLVDALRQEGFNVWIDMDLKKGTQWDRRLEKQLKTCDLCILIVSRNSYSSSWVRKELLFVQELGKPVFPILLEKTEPWLAILDTQYIELSRRELPPQSFYRQLAKKTTRNKQRGTKRASTPAKSVPSATSKIQDKIPEVMETAKGFIADASRFAQDSAKTALEKTSDVVDAVSSSPVVKSMFSKNKRKARRKTKKSTKKR